MAVCIPARNEAATIEAVVGSVGDLVAAVAETTADILVFLDADVVNFRPRYVTALTSALLADPGLQLVKGAYSRPLHGRQGEGGRVTELVARPLLERFFPALGTVTQPLAGECALTRALRSASTSTMGTESRSVPSSTPISPTDATRSPKLLSGASGFTVTGPSMS